MDTKLTAKFFSTLLVFLVAIAIASVGCQGGQLQSASSTDKSYSTPVSDRRPDIYIYARQDTPTRIPAWVADSPGDIEVESLALWGMPSEDKSAFGMGITLTSAFDASRLYNEINLRGFYAALSPEKLDAVIDLEELYAIIDFRKLYSAINLEEDIWKMLYGNTIYLVYGSGGVAESMKTAILNHDFRYYNYCETLEAAATLPSYSTTKPVAVALVEPSEALAGFLAKYADPEYLGQINMILKLGNIEIITIGLYSPHHIDVADIVELLGRESDVCSSNLGLLISVKSGLPGFLVAPAVKKILADYEFTEMEFGKFTVYRRPLCTDEGEAITVLVWVDGNSMFTAVAGYESYAESLIGATIAINR